MECINLSLEKLDELCKKWAEDVKENYRPDLIVYVAKGGYLIGDSLKKVFRVPLVGIDAVRKGNNFKECIYPILTILPSSICNLLRKIEIKSKFHKIAKKRNIAFHSEITYIKCKDRVLDILLVDDSIDTGYSMLQIKEVVKKEFPNAKIKIFSVNEMRVNNPVISSDYALFYDKILCTPMSNDSPEHKVFLKLYNSRYTRGRMIY